MFKKAFNLFLSIALLAGLISASGGPAVAQQPRPIHGQFAALPGSGPSRTIPGAAWVQSPDGGWLLAKQPGQAASTLAPQTNPGPDDYGYTWSTTSNGWIDVTDGTNANLSGDSWGKAVSIPLPFAFKYYENTYTSLWVVASGYLAFTDTGGYWPRQDSIPNPAIPNNVIAPFWSPYVLATSGKVNRVFYKSLGTAPNRYFVAEWNQVKDPSYPATYTFEVILSENGNITFQYQTMNYGTGNRWCASAGIEDSTGLDGLSYLDLCSYGPTSNSAVLFSRPDSAARVSILPKADGRFVASGSPAQFNLLVRNIGDLGTDTFDLLPNSTWPLSLFAEDGVTPLVDTDANGTVDTGPIAQNSSKKIVVKLTAPLNAAVGQADDAQLEVRSTRDINKSKAFTLQAAVPDRFAQSYSSSGLPYVNVYRPTSQSATQTGGNGYETVIATTMEGNFVQVWQAYRQNSNGKGVYELYTALVSAQGAILRPAARITDHSSATTNSYDFEPAVTVAPNGRIGIIWRQYQYRSTDGASNTNIYYLALDSAGGVVVPPTNLTNITQWYTSSLNAPRFYDPAIAATLDNRFMLAWTKEVDLSSSNWQDTIQYTLRDTSGGMVKAVAQYGSSTCLYAPNLTPLYDGSLLLAAEDCSDLTVGRLDSAGNILTSPASLPGISYTSRPDAVQLTNGNILLAWLDYYYYPDRAQYALLDQNLNVIKGATDLDSPSLVGDGFVSVTHFGSHGILTWGNSCCDYMPTLFYALVGGDGTLINSPMIFASDFTNYWLEPPSNGQGNTSLYGADDRTPPVSSAESPAFSIGPFQVSWSGTDPLSGIAAYNVWVRVGMGGAWTLWQSNTTATSAIYSAVTPDQTYYFYSQAIDNVGNLEELPSSSGDTHTTIADFQITGKIMNLAGEPVFNAVISAAGASQALNTPHSDGLGVYNLYLSGPATLDLTVTRTGYGSLPPLKYLSASSEMAGVDFVLPPEVDAITNGGFENGDLTSWQAAGALSVAVNSGAAHTGDYGLQVEALAADPSFVPAITQTLSLPISGALPTLSWMYQVRSGSPVQFEVQISSSSSTITQTINLETGGWKHAWIDLSSFSGQIVTMRFGYHAPLIAEQIWLDEISLGEKLVGSYPIFLPIAIR